MKRDSDARRTEFKNNIPARIFWKKMLGDSFRKSVLAFDKPLAGGVPGYGECVIPVLPGPGQEIAAFAGTDPSRVFVLFLTGITYTLRYFIQDDTVVTGVPSMDEANNHQEPFNEFIPFSITINDSESFRTLLNKLAGRLSEALLYKHFPVEMLAETAGSRLYDIIFSYDDLQKVPSDSVPEVGLFFRLRTTPAGLQLFLRYDKLHYREERMQQLLRYVLNSISQGIRYPDKSLLTVDFILPEEKDTILNRFNQQPEAATGLLFPEAFQQHAETMPDAIAVIHKNRRVTYRQLALLSDEIAAELTARGIQQGHIVITFGTRSIEQLAIMLAVLKCGAVLSVLDAEGAPERTGRIIADSGAALLVTTSHHQETAQRFRTMIPVVFILPEELPVTGAHIRTMEPLSPPMPAYIVYTSGTTGKPKGVVLTHTGLQNHLLGVSEVLGLSAADIFAQTAACSFDIFIMQYLIALSVGATTHIIDDVAIMDPAAFLEEIGRAGTTITELVPTYIETLADLVEREPLLLPAGLKWLISTGDSLSLPTARKWLELFPGTRILNAYGPAEASDDVCTYTLHRDNIDRYTLIPVGKPLRNVRMLILDGKKQLCPVGHPGTIYIAGTGLGAGYLNDPVKTERAFFRLHTIEDDSWKGITVYNTGDIGYWLPNGNIVFSGRQDNQVKVNGARIELGEIEKALEEVPGIIAAKVIPGNDAMDRKFICAYFLATRPLLPDDIREGLKDLLPGYMLPSGFVQLDKFPVTANGKIDINALPAPRQAMGTIGMEPVTEEEKAVHRAWTAVLGITAIGVLDNYFMLGGDSIKSIRIASKLYSEKYRVSVKEIFNRPTIRELAEVLEPVADIIEDTTSEYGSTAAFITAGLPPEQFAFLQQQYDAEAIYPLSPMQEGMLFLSLLTPASGAYLEQMSYSIKGALDSRIILQCLQALGKRHEILRTSFVHENLERAVQVVLKQREIDFSFSDLTSEDNPGEMIRMFKEADRANVFDLSAGALMRVKVFRVADNKYEFIWSHHHILMDGWCMSIIVEEFSALYRHYTGKGHYLPASVVPYRNYIKWLSQQPREEGRAFWQEYLSGYTNQVFLPGHITNTPGAFAQQEIICELDESHTAALYQLAKEHQLTISTVIHVLWGILLARYNNVDDVVFGSVVSGRPAALAGAASMLGLFINTVPVRIKTERRTFSQLLESTRDHFLESERYHHIALHEIQALSLLKTELINHLLIFENYPLLSAENDPDETADDYQVFGVEAFEQTNYDLTFTVVPGSRLRFEWAVNTYAYREKEIGKVASHLCMLISEVLKHPDGFVSDFSLLSAGEKEQMLALSTGEHRQYGNGMLVQEIFEEQVNLHGDKTALVFESKRLTYQELNIRVNQLAHYLREKGVQRNRVVGICAGRSIEMVIAVLAVIKSGGAYLPVDADYPAERVSYLLKDSKADVLLTDQVSPPFEGMTIELGDLHLEGYPADNPLPVNTIDDLLYVIYTSGSTGLPKGAMIPQRPFINATYAWRECYQLSAAKTSLLQMAGFSFDVFSGDIARALLNGGKMVICPAAARLDVEHLYRLIRDEGISLFEATPALIVPLMDYVMEQDLDIASLRLLIFGADICRVDQFNRIKSRYGNRLRILNSYGVTEATIDTSYFEGEPQLSAVNGQVPIGRPMPNMRTYVLDQHLQLLPVGMTGELFIGGAGIGNGYLGREELTAARFVNDPFNPGAKMYRTGDRCKWQEDGNLLFLGRDDDQVKIRGHRIATGEIESLLMKYGGVTDVVIVATETAGAAGNLCAYYVAGKKTEPAVLRGWLADRLPAYMVPDHFVHLHQMPLTPNGKVDRKNLPAPVGNTRYEGRLPAGQLETQVTAIWAAVLQRHPDEIRVTDNFFEIGGDSIKIMHIRNKLIKTISKKIAVVKFFELPTIETFCAGLQSETVPETADALEESALGMLTETLKLVGNDE
ncbi:non-ribosomal peptide synthetase [Chitinophaga sp.]|uniref:non-ribosomal peptide synthetase n=1 Tax=Chitinophaga sp. TaxID=1869181 RepID=UPI002CA6ED51|nr:non-ribosomal peptide synthetase [Chitinophaga sp.]HWV64278.1 amino acid adenylation domain-containing protein [Chitinophaga sp.]